MKAENVEKGAAEKVTYDTKPIREVAGRRAYNINFASGSADILPTSYATLDEVAGYLVTENTKIAIIGHTDSQGNPEKNRTLSEQRAMSVKRYLMNQGRSAMPSNRISRVEGHGQDEPIASNATADGRAQNRRVVLEIGH
jgi:OOP family OmpA-OmpF porin